MQSISQYIYYILKWYQPYLEESGEGSTKQKELKADRIKELFIPIPPLAEQHRIVAKIEELLPYIERYGKAEEHLTTLNTTFPEALKSLSCKKRCRASSFRRTPMMSLQVCC